MSNGRIRGRILRLSKVQQDQQWEIAELLCTIFDEGLYRKWGYPTMTAYLAHELDMRPRNAQHMRRVWAWHLTLPFQGRAWARTLSIGVLRSFVGEIDAYNWKEWRGVLESCTKTKAEKMRRDVVHGKIEIGRETRARRAMKKTVGMPLVHRMCALRTMGMSAKEVGDAMGVSTRDVRSALRFVQLYLPLDLYEHIKAMGSSGVVEVETLKALLDWFVEPQMQHTGTAGRR